jgi:hypothetical protein
MNSPDDPPMTDSDPDDDPSWTDAPSPCPDLHVALAATTPESFANLAERDDVPSDVADALRLAADLLVVLQDLLRDQTMKNFDPDMLNAFFAANAEDAEETRRLSDLYAWHVDDRLDQSREEAAATRRQVIDTIVACPN